MDAQTITLVLGPFGVTVLALYISSKLWAAHEREDAARDARIAAQDIAFDKMADGIRDSTALLIEIRDLRRREARRP